LKSESVFVGVGKIWIDIPECKSLKEKRGVLKPLMNGIREKFRVSVSEIGGHDSRKHAVIGFGILGNDRGFIHKYMISIIKDLPDGKNIKIMDFKTEILCAGSASLSFETPMNTRDSLELESVESEWIKMDEKGDET